MAKKEDAIAKTTTDIVGYMAEKYSMDRTQLLSTLRKSLMAPKKVVKQNQVSYLEASEEEIFVFLQVAKEYELNPFTREIVAFVSSRGQVVPYVTIDGWITLINRQKRYAGIKTQNLYDDSRKLYGCTCVIRVRDEAMPEGYYTVEITEMLNECKRNTDPWTQSESRMLRHKAVIQCARYAFGLGGLYDEDEADRIREREAIDVTPGAEEGKPLMPKAKELPAGSPPPPPPPPKASPPRESKPAPAPEKPKADTAGMPKHEEAPPQREPGEDREEDGDPFGDDAPTAGQREPIERKDETKMTEDEKRTEIVANAKEFLRRQGVDEQDVDDRLPQAIEHFSMFESEGKVFKKSKVEYLKGKWLNTTLGKSRRELDEGG